MIRNLYAYLTTFRRKLSRRHLIDQHDVPVNIDIQGRRSRSSSEINILVGAVQVLLAVDYLDVERLGCCHKRRNTE